MQPPATRRRIRALLCLALLLVAMPATATTFLVNVGGSSPPRFSPASITIATGDTVVFVNKGGIHNVVADDGSFRCARGCMGDANGGTGAPSSANWAVSVSFPDAGTVGYFCETHGAPGEGMFGTIRVVGPVKPVPAAGSAALLALLVLLALGALNALRCRNDQRNPR